MNFWKNFFSIWLLNLGEGNKCVYKGQRNAGLQLASGEELSVLRPQEGAF
jgi:hypothetical protein